MRYITILLLIFLSFGAEASSRVDARMRIYPMLSRGEVLCRSAKMEKQACGEVDKYVDLHRQEPEWIVSRMQMYWKNRYSTVYVNGGVYSRGEGSADVPTLRFAGGRDWACGYATPALENIKPYMDFNDEQMYLLNKESKQWEWVDNAKTAHIIENINLSIMNKAMYSAFLYWLRGDEKYAKFAYDIFKVYVESVLHREAPKTEKNHSNGHLLGLSSFEVIHEKVVVPLTLTYSFLYDFLHDDKRNAEKKKLVGDTETVFSKFAEQIIANGVPDNNWNVFQANFIAYLALSLEENSVYENGKGREYYIDFILNKNGQRQRSLKSVRDIYDENTGFWRESAGYSINTTKDLLEVLFLVDAMGSDEILKDFEIVEKAAYACLEYEFPNMRTSAFGDSGYQVIDSMIYEILLSYYKKYGKEEKMAKVSNIIREKQEARVYDREKDLSLFKLFNYVDKIETKTNSEEKHHSAMFYAPNINLTMLRNGTDKINALMLVNAGTGFNHNNNNGINLELYGKGYVLGIDKGRGSSYWRADHRDYYHAALSHNTVIVDGVSANKSPAMGKGVVSRHKMHSAYPDSSVDAKDSPFVSYVDNEFDEQSTKSVQRRFNSIIRTSVDSGYYLDIFRSAKREGSATMHDYLYHNLGQSLDIYAKDGKKLELLPSVDLSSKGGKAKGYDYLKDEKSIGHDEDFKATFDLELEKAKSVSMDMWVAKQENRKIYAVKSPRNLKGYGGVLSKKIDALEVPAIVIRKYGQAWDSPFVAVYQPYFKEEGADIKTVDFLKTDNAESVALEVISKDKSKQLIINSTSTENKTCVGDSILKGIYAVVSCEEGTQSPRYIFKAEALGFKWGEIAVISPEPNTVFIEWIQSDLLKVDFRKRFCLEMPKECVKTIFYIDSTGEKHKLEGVIRNTPRGKKMSFYFEKY